MDIDVREADLLNYDTNKQLAAVQDSYNELQDSLGSGGTVETRWSLKPVPQGV